MMARALPLTEKPRHLGVTGLPFLALGAGVQSATPT